MKSYVIIDSNGYYKKTVFTHGDPAIQLETGDSITATPIDQLPVKPLDNITRIHEIKRKASDAIVKIAPEWKQRNMIARGLELTNKIATGAALTSAEQAESDAIKAIWVQIEGIRAASNQAETNGIPVDQFNP